MEDPTIKSFPWVEDFEQTTFPPRGWKTHNVDNDSKMWIRSLMAGVDHSKCASIHGYTKGDDWLITLPIQIPKNGLLKYSAKTYGSRISVAISTKGSKPEDFKEIATQKTIGSYKEYTQDLSEFQGQTVYIGFHHTAYQSMDLDHIQVVEGQPVSIDHIDYEAITSSALGQGSKNEPLTKLNIVVQGDVGSLQLNNLTLDLENSHAIEKLYLYKTETESFRHETLVDEIEGVDYAKKFGGTSGDDKDWLKLIVRGCDAANKETGKTETYLADYRFDDNTKDYILDS
ncbi:DUF4465 domain-containing protein [Halosquirtibacter laminarini]|uniref:DUF4465 domain-containing protein n=1 Tax=Halosquirtibacter laminarini TaxID=3374600 RepID=A0AC61NHX4_9BACT|nr:DUF4465 domain-containing protein [Prolixibacteraceae bacterium]